jgi:thioredoxin reductase (NADPH)
LRDCVVGRSPGVRAQRHYCDGGGVPEAALENLGRYEGVGVYYGATHVEALLCSGEEVAIVGGGNSAGQAAVFLSGHARHVHLLVRSAGLSDTMSRYLIRRIEESPSITLRPYTQVQALHGNGHLGRLEWRNSELGVTEVRHIHHLYLMTGASPNRPGCRVASHSTTSSLSRRARI